MEKEYKIGERVFTQRPLVLGQWKQLMEHLGGAKGDPVDIFGSSRALAIILREKDRNLKDKDVEELATYLDENVDGMTTLEVVEDFFGMSPIQTFTARLEGIRSKIRIRAGGSTAPSAPSPGETSPGGMRSSGDTPRENAGHS